jgi:hypothetical protein
MRLLALTEGDCYRQLIISVISNGYRGFARFIRLTNPIDGG